MKAIAAVLAALLLAIATAATALAERRVYVLSQDDGVLSAINTDVDEITARVTLGGKPASFTIDGHAKEAFVTQPEASRIDVVDLNSRAVIRRLDIGGQPFGIAASNDRKLFVGDWSANCVSVIDAETGAQLGVVPVGRSPAHLVITKDDSRLYVANRESNTVSVIDAAKLAVISEIPVGGGPFALALLSGEEKLVVANVQSATLSIIDTSALKVVATTPSEAMPYGVAAAHGGAAFLVSNQEGGSVSIFDAQSREPRAEIKVGRYPEGLAIIEDRRKAYVANWFSASVSVVDLEAGAEIKRIECPDGPRMVLAGSATH
jgi:YVTN family beta-propeller protein